MVIISQDNLFPHIAGALYGLAVGDALGAVTEGMKPKDIISKYGHITGFLSQSQSGTDDTEFTLFYIELLKKYGLAITSETIAKHWLSDIYHPSEIYKGAGFSEAMTLQNLKKGLMPPQSGQHVHAWSDGLTMCAATLGCACAGNPNQASDLAEVFGNVSHHGEGIFSGKAVAAAVASAVTDNNWDTIYKAALNSVPRDSWTYYSIQKGLEIGQSHNNVKAAIDSLYNELVCDYYYWADLAPEAVGVAFGLLSAAQGDFLEAVLGAVNFGRDSDTIAAIVGALSGSKNGIAVIPSEFTEKVKTVPGRCIRSIAGRSIASAILDLLEIIFKSNNNE